MAPAIRRHWREICEDVLREKDTNRVNALLEELLEALDEHTRNRKRKLTAPSDS
jgi:hypothetical protein